MFLDPIQKRALSRSVHLEAVYLEALLYKALGMLVPWRSDLILSILIEELKNA